MFLRPFRIKSRSAVNGKERKLLRQRLNEKFVDIDTLLSLKCLLESLRLVTSSGIQVTVIFADKQPVFFELDDQLIPTVYTLCQAHDLLKYVYTWRPVLGKMLGGADLMLPGIYRGGCEEDILKTLKKDEICAVGLVGQRDAVGIARCLMSWEEMQTSHMRGKGFKVLHLYGDKLWEMGSLTDAQITEVLAPAVSASHTGTCSEVCLREQDVEKENPSSSSSSFLKHGCTKEGIEQKQETYCDMQMGANAGLESTDGPLYKEPQKSMDELLKGCFFKALKAVAETAKLPLLTSTFYSAFMLPQCPAGMRLDVKKSSYKKLSQFLHKMCDMGVIKVEETMKGVESITNIDCELPLVKSAAASSDSAVGMTKQVEEISVTELYSPSHKLLPVFHCSGHDKSSFLSVAQVRDSIRLYVKLNQLQSALNPSVVVLDPVLCEALHHKTKFVCEELTWGELVERILQCMKQAHSINHGGSEAVIRKGPLQPVLMTVMQRMGNKKVTVVENLEFYGIPAEKVGHIAQKLAAASTSVETTPGPSKVLVQGNAVNIITKILKDEYGLPSKFIHVVDKLKQSRKKGGKTSV